MNELQGRLPHIEARKDALISAQTFEKYARLVRNMNVLGGTLGINGLGGLEITVTPSQGGSASEYAGPFALSPSGNGMYVGSGTVYAGASSISFGGGSVSDQYAILTVTYSGGSYSTSLSGSDSGTPTQTNDSYKVVLGRLTSSGVEQWQYGDIYVAGRVV